MKNIHYINAGAGSGKTYTLTELLADKIVNGFCKPFEVILTTFTELAASEFREKSREMLYNKNLPEAANLLEGATIGTVHSVANMFVTKYWYLLKRSTQTNVISDNDRNFYINQSLVGIASAKDLEAFASFRKEFGWQEEMGWRDDIHGIIEQSQSFNIQSFERSIELSREQLVAIFNDEARLDVVRIKMDLESYANYIQSTKTTDKATNQLKSINELLKADSYYYKNINEIQNLINAPVGGGKGAGNEGVQHLSEYLPKLLRAKTYGELLCDYIERIFSLAGKWMYKYEAYKRENKLIDFNDMEQLFVQLLYHEIVQKDISENYKLLLVDEFQDSNPTQLRIFDKLSELVTESVWVGDPKQSIYGFRGSDAELIKAITSLFPQEEKGLTLNNLSHSYRSVPSLVSLTNDIFTPAFANYLNREQVCLESKRENVSNCTTYHWHSDCKNKEDHYCSLAQQVGRLIMGDLGIIEIVCKKGKVKRPPRPNDIAILVKTNDEATKIADALRTIGIKTSAADSNLTLRAEFKLLESLLKYILNPTNDFVKAELFCLLEDEKIEHILEDRIIYQKERREKLEKEETPNRWRANHPLFARIDRIRERIKEQSVSALVESLLLELDLIDVVKKWGDFDNRRSNLDLFIRLAQQYEEQCLCLGIGATLNGFISYIASDISQNAISESDDAVRVLTYHKAKGLEWNIVILGSLNNDALDVKSLISRSYFGIHATAEPDSISNNLYPSYYLSFLPWYLSDIKSKLPNEVSAEIEATERFKSIENRTKEECKRLLYVGITRARDYLISTSYNKGEMKWIDNIRVAQRENPATNSNLSTIDVWGTGQRACFAMLNNDDSFESSFREATPMQFTRDSNGMHTYQPKYVSPSKVEPAENCKVTLVETFNERLTIKGAEDMMDQVGNFLHAFFSLYEPEKKDNTQRAAAFITQFGLTDAIPEADKVVQAIDNLYGFLRKEYGKPIAVYKEYPFLRKRGGQIVRGSIDLVWETEGGIVIVDYKSFPGKINQILDANDRNYAGKYSGQLAEYSQALALAGKNVLASFIYYAVQGSLVRLQF